MKDVKAQADLVDVAIGTVLLTLSKDKAVRKCG